MSGMIFGNGFSGDARKSVMEYLSGYSMGYGVFTSAGGGGGVDGPGFMLRKWFSRGLWGLMFPFFIYWFMTFAAFVGPGKEVCVYAIYGFRSTCSLVRRSSFYTFTMAGRHFFWILFFYLFEGEGAWVLLSSVSKCLVFFFGVLVSFYFPVAGKDMVLACLLMVCWSSVGGTRRFIRWMSLVFVMTGFGVFALICEVLFVGDIVVAVGGEEVVSCAVEPHRFLSLEVPVGSCVMSKGYFLDRTVGCGMSDEERVMALKGDRFLKVLAVQMMSENAEQVSSVVKYDKAQEDRVFALWLQRAGVVSENGKKTRASFAEVLWGEVFDLYRQGLVEYVRVWEAYVVFHMETAALVTECCE